MLGRASFLFAGQVTLSTSLRKIFSHSAVTLVGTALSALLSVVYVSLGARLLGPDGYGKVGATIALANLFFLALNPLETGITLGVARLSGRGELDALRQFSRSMLRGLALLGALLLLAFAALVWALDESFFFASRDATLWLGVFCAAAFVACGPRAGMRGSERFGALAINIVLESAVRAAVGLGLLWAGGGPGAMLAGYGVGMSVAVLHGEWALRKGLGPIPARARGPTDLRADVLLPLRSLSAPLLGLNLYLVTVSNLDVLSATRFLDATQAGLYAGAASLTRMVPVAVQPLLLVLFSRLAAESAAGKDTRATLRLGTLIVVSALGSSLLVPLACGKWVLSLLLGDAFLGAHAVLLTQWATACVVTTQFFAAESMLATSRLRAGWLFAVPAFVLFATLWLFHDSAVTIARASFAVCAVMGSLTCLVLARLRRAPDPASTTST
jgi:O-antigen/teichoic acid export membrane protein